MGHTTTTPAALWSECLMMWIYDVLSAFWIKKSLWRICSTGNKMRQIKAILLLHSLFYFLSSLKKKYVFASLEKININHRKFLMILENITWTNSSRLTLLLINLIFTGSNVGDFVLAVPVAPAAASWHFLCPLTGRTQPAPRQCVPSFILSSLAFSSHGPFHPSVASAVSLPVHIL